MAGGEPPLRPVMQRIVVETRTVGWRKDAGLYVGLSDECHQSMNGEAAKVAR